MAKTPEQILLEQGDLVAMWRECCKKRAGIALSFQEPYFNKHKSIMITITPDGSFGFESIDHEYGFRISSNGTIEPPATESELEKQKTILRQAIEDIEERILDTSLYNTKIIATSHARLLGRGLKLPPLK
jgi:hypothetical protein